MSETEIQSFRHLSNYKSNMDLINSNWQLKMLYDNIDKLVIYISKISKLILKNKDDGIK
jgi:hypothetical protein